jgi:hypothetical protein
MGWSCSAITNLVILDAWRANINSKKLPLLSRALEVVVLGHAKHCYRQIRAISKKNLREIEGYTFFEVMKVASGKAASCLPACMQLYVSLNIAVRAWLSSSTL